MRILWYSNAPFVGGTGYSTQTALTVKRLIADGHKVAIANNYGLHGSIIEWGPDTPILPQGADLYSSDILPAHYHAWMRDEPGWLITLYDVWPLRAENVAGVVPFIASWVPVDHVPVPLETLAWFDRTRALPIAMSEFGREQFVAAGVDTVRYIPHALDPEVFKPTPALTNGKTAREALGIPADAFLVIINAANKGAWPPRKAWAEMFGMLGVFMRSHPDVWAYIHTERQGIANGIDLERLAVGRAIPLDRIRWADRYALAIGSIGQADMAAIYSAAGDGNGVKLLTSMGEGFGLPVAEAAMCGVPSIVSNFSAQPEIVGDTGWLVEGQPWWDAAHGADFWMPFIDAGVAALDEAYELRGERLAERGRRARERALERYSIDRVWESGWRPLLAEMEARLPDKMPKVRPPGQIDLRQNRAERRAARRKPR